MFQRILVPLDGSKQAERAIPVAASLARASGGSIVLVRIVLPPVEYGKYAAPHLKVWERRFYEANRSEAASSLANTLLKHSHELAGITTDIGVATGLVTPTIFSVAQREQADLIVMCSKDEAKMKRWMFGSAAQEAVQHSPVPVLVVHGHGMKSFIPGPAQPLHVLVTLDGSRQAEQALPAALQILEATAKLGQVTLHLVRVVDLPTSTSKAQPYLDHLPREQALQDAKSYLKQVIEQLQTGNTLPARITISPAVAAGKDIVRAITAAAEDIERTEPLGARILIVMASHERGKLLRLLMGSITEQVLHSTALPLLVVHPQETSMPKEQQRQ